MARRASLSSRPKGARHAADFPSPAKASEMLTNPPHGKALTGGQKRLFQMIKHGGKPTRLRKK